MLTWSALLGEEGANAGEWPQRKWCARHEQRKDHPHVDSRDA